MAKKHNRSRKSGRPGKSGPDLGDIPKPIKRTYNTASCPTPRMSDVCVLRGSQDVVIAATPTASAAASYNITLANSGVVVSGFDQYRIVACRLTIAPQNNAVGMVTTSTTSLVPLYCVLDYDDSTNLTTASQAKGYNNCISLFPGESCQRTFRPRAAVSAYTGAFGGFANISAPWCDFASSTIQHYGVKVFIPGAAAAQTLLQTWDVSIETWVELRNAI